MYSLVFYTKSKKTSVVSTDDFFEEKGENEEALITYGKRQYHAIVVKKSGKRLFRL